MAAFPKLTPSGATPDDLPGRTKEELMSAAEIDEYLDHLDEPKRSTLIQLRRDILAVIPNAEQCLSYAVPGFKVAGKTIAGFAAFKNHLSYLPHSGSVFPELAEELAGYEKSSGALRFPIDQSLPTLLVAKLIAVRLRQAFPRLPDDISGGSVANSVAKPR
jgi:uncharacterized protein YdhG (YjbR/CyaY superfamily)